MYVHQPRRFLNRPTKIGLLFWWIMVSTLSTTSAQITTLDSAHWYMVQADSLISIAYNYHESIENTLKAQAIYTKELGPLDTLVAETHLYLGENYLYLEDYNNAILNFQKEGQIYKQLDNVTPTLIANNYNNLGLCNEFRGDYQKAFDYYSLCIPIYQKAIEGGKDKWAYQNLITTYNNLAICYNSLGQYQKGLQYFEKTLNGELELYGEKHRAVASSYKNLGLTYKNLGKYALAEEYLLKSLEIYQEIGETNTYRFANLYGSIGMLYYLLENYDKALSFCEKELLLKLQKTHPEDMAVTSPMVNVGRCLAQKGNFDKARTYLTQALYIRNQNLPSYHYKILDIEIELSEIERREQKYSAATQRMEGLLTSLLDGKEVDDFENIDAPIHYLAVLHQKGIIHHSAYQNSKDKTQLYQALKAYEPAVRLIDFLRTGIDENTSKEVLLDKNYAIYGNTLDILYELWTQTKDNRYIYQAFNIAERGKSALLLESVKNTHAKTFAGIPTDLLEQENVLKLDIALAEKRRFEAKTKDEQSKINQFGNELFDLYRKYETLRNRFEQEYPEYYKLKYETSILDAHQVQATLVDDSTSMLSYFLSDTHLFVFVVNTTGIQFYRQLLNTPLSETIQTFITSISEHPLVQGSQRQQLEDNYITSAYELYQILFEPYTKHLQRKLIILPHNLIGYVPFECLLKKQPTQNYAFRDHAYLLHDYQMSYAYSANLLYEMKQAPLQTATKNFIGFAPKFNNEGAVLRRVTPRYDKLGALTMNIPEVEMIQKKMFGDAFIAEHATEDNFVQYAKDYKIIHLATHGIANDQAGDYCYLAFTEQADSIENEILYVKELYPLQLKADMVVLSACETATGELKKGEGIVSIARGFSYAGAKSIVTTLWSINDATTAQIMEYFYNNILDGQSKDQALWSAQKAYLQQSRNQYAHPVYWAAFIAVGNMNPIVLQETPWTTIGIVGIGLLLISVFFLWRRIKT